MGKAGFGIVFGLGLAAVSGWAGPAVGQGFDNPGTDTGNGETPCLVLNGYDVTPDPPGEGGEEVYRASASIGNICGRTLDVSFCFLFAEPVEERDRACYAGSIRPWGVTAVEQPDVPALIVGPRYEWRYAVRDAG